LRGTRQWKNEKRSVESWYIRKAVIGHHGGAVAQYYNLKREESGAFELFAKE
jgi:hypothetical protein